MQRNEAFRVAYIDIVESLKDEKTHMEFFSKPVKANVDWKEQEIYSIKLPGDPKLGERETAGAVQDELQEQGC